MDIVRKKPRPDEQVHSAGALDVTGLLGSALCGLCLVVARPVSDGFVHACVRSCSPVRVFVCSCVGVRARVCVHERVA